MRGMRHVAEQRELVSGFGSNALWGYCDTCSGWILTKHWSYNGEDSRCPQCGGRPSALEKVNGEVTQVTVMLELPPGAVEPLIG